MYNAQCRIVPGDGFETMLMGRSSELKSLIAVAHLAEAMRAQVQSLTCQTQGFGRSVQGLAR